MSIVERAISWGPVAFGVLIFAPMWAAALDALNITLPYGITNLTLTMAIGLSWGLVAKLRGQWL